MSLQAYVNSESLDFIKYFSSRLICAVIEKVLILTADGRTLTGTLLSCDQVTNLVLSQTVERVIRSAENEEESAEVSHGLYLIRGENVAVCGLVDEELDASIDWVKVRGEVIGGIKHV